jgi:serine phosphatase RsbU (regulator of sigma subunit)
VRHLQGELLGTVDRSEGLDVAVGYQPAVSALGLGGDWFDVVAVSAHETVLVVGDVVGHGVEAAAQMAQAKGVVRALVLTSPLGEVCAGATRSLRHFETSYVATVALAAVDRRARRVTWTTAGHLPPAIAEPGQPAELLWSEVQPPVGMAADRVEASTRAYAPGSWLVLYTDGLIERRPSGLDDRLGRLLAVLEELPQAIGASAARDRILSELVGDQPVEDDIAIVVARLD